MRASQIASPIGEAHKDLFMFPEKHLILAANEVLYADMKDPTNQTLDIYPSSEASTSPVPLHNPPEAKQQASGPSAWKYITTFYVSPATKKIRQRMQIRLGELPNISELQD